VDTLNLEVQQQDASLPFPLFGIVDYAALDRIAFTARLSTRADEGLPRRVVISYPTAPTALAALIGWDLSAGDIVLETQSEEVRDVYSRPLANKYAFDAIKNLYIATNFTRGGMDVLQQPSTILAEIPVNVEQGQLIVSEPSVPLRVNAYTALHGEAGDSTLEFRLLDENARPVAIGTDNPWTVNVLIEWEQDIDPTRLAQSQTESKFA
jgi:hypothetical protein